MDIEKIIYLVAIAVYGILSTCLSVVRTLKTSKISSEVKAVLPPIDDGQTNNDAQPNDDVQPNDDEQGVQVLSLDELLALFDKIREHKN